MSRTSNIKMIHKNRRENQDFSSLDRHNDVSCINCNLQKKLIITNVLFV